MLIFRRTLMREMASNALLVFSVLLMITLTTMLIRFLGQAASGALANDAVVAFLGFSIIGYLPVLLSLTVFIAVLMTLTRCYRDSEMVVWFTAGLSITAWLRPVAAFAVPAVFAIAVMSLVVSPWALRKSDEYRQQMDSRDDMSSVAPGVFKESKHDERVYFVESFADAGSTVSNIFMRSIQHQKLGILVARHGYQTISPKGDRYLMLLNGRRYEGTPGMPDYKIMAFERYAIRIYAFEASLSALTLKSLPTLRLLQDRSPANMGELLWRVGLPFSAFVLALMAIPLSFVNPRAGRSLNLIMAVLLYMIYSNFISISQAWVAQDKLPAYLGMWLVHGLMAAILLLLFYHRLVLTPFYLSWFRGGILRRRRGRT